MSFMTHTHLIISKHLFPAADAKHPVDIEVGIKRVLCDTSKYHAVLLLTANIDRFYGSDTETCENMTGGCADEAMTFHESSSNVVSLWQNSPSSAERGERGESNRPQI